ncbi:MAG TPA: hypothetical protein EYQ54_20795 [Myxococcales bacterium]|nr:hypothetical protein [Myxococcales bacterium]
MESRNQLPTEGAEAEDPRADQSPGLERFLMHYLEDSALWPIVVVIIGHAVALASFALLLAVRERKVSAILATTLLLWGSFLALRWEFRKHGHLGIITGLLAITWLLSALTAYVGHTLKFL